MKANNLFLPLLFILLASACDSQSRTDQPTTVYLVRHAEKDLTDLSAQDPPLT